ncbi:MAG TPA: ABC transporter permease, partial [Vicinamibacterales bacterium]|nr:ABC transporter permease [Vicinamibacterales bacterium]
MSGRPGARRQPPPVAGWLLWRLLPRGDREFIVGDLVEEFRERAGRAGRIRARCWFWRQTVSTLLRRRAAVMGSTLDREGGYRWNNAMQHLGQDLRYAFRQLRRSPGLALSVIVTLALALGGSTAIYSVLRAVLLRPLPYASADRLVAIRADVEGFTNVGVLSAPELADLRERATGAFEGFAGIWGTSGALTGDDPEHIALAWVTANTFPLLGVDPILGRAFRDADDLPASERVVLIGEELWRRRYGADPAVLGRRVGLDDHSYTVVGVMPANLQVPRGAFALELRRYDAWLPQRFWENRDQRWLGIISRLRPGISLARARDELAAVAGDLSRAYSGYSGQDFRLTAVPLHGDLVRGVRPALMALSGAVAFVLLIACTNVAGLLLARGVGRESEVAIRRALGASHVRLATELLAESLVLAIAGGLAG